VEDAWYRFTARNAQTIYGWGMEGAAQRYADLLNRGREGNLYAANRMTDEDLTKYAAKYGRLEDNTGAVNLNEALGLERGPDRA
jgi:hypothetical protein